MSESGAPARAGSQGPLALLDAFPFEAAAMVIGPEGIRDSRGSVLRERPWRSVTKSVTGYAIAIGLEEGKVDLDDEVGPPGSTLRHLLAHASGLFYDSDQVLMAPGKRRHYSNYAIDEAGRHLERAAGISFGDWVTERVLEPLGMRSVRWTGSPSVGGFSSLADLSLFVMELLRPTLVRPATLEMARSAHFPELVGIMPGFGKQDPNPFGLGFEVRGEKSPHWTGSGNSPETFGHFGMLGTAYWVDPRADLALLVGTDHTFCDAHREVMPRLSDAVLAAWGGV